MAYVYRILVGKPLGKQLHIRRKKDRGVRSLILMALAYYQRVSYRITYRKIRPYERNAVCCIIIVT